MLSHGSYYPVIESCYRMLLSHWVTCNPVHSSGDKVSRASWSHGWKPTCCVHKWGSQWGPCRTPGQRINSLIIVRVEWILFIRDLQANFIHGLSTSDVVNLLRITVLSDLHRFFSIKHRQRGTTCQSFPIFVRQGLRTHAQCVDCWWDCFQMNVTGPYWW